MNSNAAAKRRRAGIQVNDPVNQSTPSPQNGQSQLQSTQQSGFTLPQVIALVDRRLTNLEKFMKETVDNKSTTDNGVQNIGVSSDFTNILNEYFQEMDGKFQMLAEEITNLKDIVLKLQSFTMEVNKTLYFDKTGIVLEETTSNTNINDKSNLEETTSEKHITFSFSPEP
jgi:hypothetical protein